MQNFLTNQQAIAGDVQRQRRGFMQLIHQISKAAKGKRLATAKSDFEHTRMAEIAQHLSGGRHRPGTLALHIA